MAYYLLVFVLGILLGSLMAYFLNRWRTGALEERLKNKEEQLAELKIAFDKNSDEIDRMITAINLETQKRSAAEERNSRIPELEALLKEKDKSLAERQNEITLLKTELSKTQTQLQEERKAADEKFELLRQAEQKLSDAFKALSKEALDSNTHSFLKLAEDKLGQFQQMAKGDLEQRQTAINELVKPLKDSLEKVGKSLNEFDTKRAEAFAGLKEQINFLSTAQTKLQTETANLVKALREPKARGNWGEMQLRRVAELSGMLEYCDFDTQVQTKKDDTAYIPDMVVRLPNNKRVIVDAKTPLKAYLDALEAEDEESKRAKLVEHANQVNAHIQKLGSKSYWKQFDNTVEFVVMFLPGEAFFSSALEFDPALIETGVNNRVVLATPTTLIALLRAVAYGWRQEQIAENAKMISELGKELYSRMVTLAGHISDIGKGLSNALEAYNKSVGSLERNILPQARRFKALGAGSESDIAQVEPIEKTPREIINPELEQK